jgi:hypothetical protein
VGARRGTVARCGRGCGRGSDEMSGGEFRPGGAVVSCDRGWMPGVGVGCDREGRTRGVGMGIGFGG